MKIGTHTCVYAQIKDTTEAAFYCQLLEQETGNVTWCVCQRYCHNDRCYKNTDCASHCKYYTPKEEQNK